MMKKFINAHTHNLTNHENTLEVFVTDYKNKFKLKGKYNCLGIHPWFVDSFSDKTSLLDFEEELRNALKTDQFFALGEIGLDRLRAKSWSLQSNIFKQQLFLANKYQIPRIVIHNVKASSDILNHLKVLNYKPKIILHDYNENIQIFKSFERNFITYTCLGSNLFKSNSAIVKNIHHLPIHNILLETDDSELTIQEVYKRAAGLLKIDVNKLLSQVALNFNTLCKSHPYP